MTARSQRHLYYLTHDKEIVYFSGFTDLQPGESIAVDIAQLRDRQQSDRQGRLLPLNADKGQIHWSVLGAGVRLDARVEQIDLEQGTAASYACAECCNNTVHTELFPSTLNGFVGDPPVTFFAEQTPEDCEGNMGPTEEVQVSHIWFDDPDIIDVQGEDTVFCVGPGSTSLTAFVPVGIGEGESNAECPEEPEGGEEEIFVPVEILDFHILLGSNEIRPSQTPGAPPGSNTTGVTITTFPGTQGLFAILSVRKLNNSGGHVSHPTRPASTLGSFAASEGTTNSSGLFETTYTAPIFGGKVIIEATVELRDKEQTLTIKVPDLLELGAGAHYNLIGATSTHPGNHYGTAAANAGLVAIAADYRDEYYPGATIPDGERLGFNDQSLIYGGKFDIPGNWSTANSQHAEHRLGRNCDVRSFNVPASRHETLEAIFANNGSPSFLDETNTASPHWHLRF